MNRTDDFLNIRLTTTNIDRFYHRKAIFNALQGSVGLLKGRLLDIGCGKMPYRSFILDNSSVENYIGLDIESAIRYDLDIKPDYEWDGIRMPFSDRSFDCAVATEVLEHCPDPTSTLKEAFRVLKEGGVFFFTVPFLWNLHEVPHDEYRYTPFSLRRHLQEAGFEKIEIKPLGGWHASLAQMLGLWVRRSPMQNRIRLPLSLFLLPFYRLLIYLDKPNKFGEGQMITGLTGIAFK